jgi:hypothetical protein
VTLLVADFDTLLATMVMFTEKTPSWNIGWRSIPLPSEFSIPVRVVPPVVPVPVHVAV